MMNSNHLEPGGVKGSMTDTISMHLWQVSTEYVGRHFAAVDLILINPYCKLRKLFTMKHRP